MPDFLLLLSMRQYWSHLILEVILSSLFGKDLYGSNTGDVKKSSQGEGDFRIMNS